MNILVTGGTGFIGEHFIPELLERGHKVRLLIRNIEKAKKMFGDRCEYFVADINKRDALIGSCKNIDMVFHMVAKVGNQLLDEKSMREFRYVNVEGTKNIAEEAQRSNVKKFIFVSSIAAMGIVPEKLITEESKCYPLLPYQISKYEAEQLLLNKYKEEKFPVIIIRPTKVYGVGEHEYSYLTLAKICKRGFFPKIGQGENYTSNVYITDLVQSLILLVDKGRLGETYIITSHNSIAMEDTAKVIAESLGVKLHLVPIAKTFMVFSANIIERIFDLIGRKPPVTKKNIEATVADRIYDIRKAKVDLNYIPQVEMKDGIRKVINWYKETGII